MVQQRYRVFVEADKNVSLVNVEESDLLLNDDTRNDMQFKLEPEQSLREKSGKQKLEHAKGLIYFTERYKNCSENMMRANLPVHDARFQFAEYVGESCAAACRTAKHADTEMTKNAEFKAVSLGPVKYHMEVR